MLSQQDKKQIAKQLDEFHRLCESIRQSTYVPKDKNENDKQARIKKLLTNYADFVEYYFPHYATTKPAKFHKDAAKRVLNDKKYRGAEVWARGHAKSVTFNILIPMWLKAKGELRTMVLVGKSEDNAKELISDLQAELMSNHRYIADFGEQFNFGDWQEGKFTTKDEIAFFARGRGQSPRGLRKKQFRPDYIVCDDIDDDELCENPKRVRKLVKWILEALFPTMDMGRGRFVIVGNLISKNSVMAAMMANTAMKVSQINARDKDGNPTWSEKYTKEELDDVERFQGYISFQKEYMNNPIQEGTVFKNAWMKYKPMARLQGYETLVAYCDPSFKGSSKNDYKAIVLIGRTRTEFHIIRCFARQCSVSEMVKWYFDLWDWVTEKGAVASYWIEGVFMQHDLLFDAFQHEGLARKRQLPLRPDTRAKPDKFLRIESLSAYFERGDFYWNESRQNDPDEKTAMEQMLAIEKGSSTADDFPDALEGAVYIAHEQTRNPHEQKTKFVKRTRKNDY